MIERRNGCVYAQSQLYYYVLLEDKIKLTFVKPRKNILRRFMQCAHVPFNPMPTLSHQTPSDKTFDEKTICLIQCAAGLSGTCSQLNLTLWISLNIVLFEANSWFIYILVNSKLNHNTLIILLIYMT